MRPFASLDPAALRAFYYAAHLLHFTRAAKAAGLTQSGVSQHVARLEQELGAPLFHRSGRKVSLTEPGKHLLRFADRYLDSVEALQDRVRRGRRDLSGIVRYAMPDSCLYTPHFPLLLEKRESAFPGVRLRVRICPSEKVIELLLRREIDFGFISKPIKHPAVELSHFATEEYLLVSARKEHLQPTSPAEALSLPYVSYPGMDDLFTAWFRERFPRHRPPAAHELRVQAEINSLRGALILVEKGAGCAFVQRHCVQELLSSRRAFAAKDLAENRIYVCAPKGEEAPARVRAVLAAFASMRKPG